MNKLVIIIAIALVIIVGGYFLLRGGYQAPAPTSPTAPSTEGLAGAREITVIGTEFNFNPSSINVKAGEKIKLTFKNNGGASHNLVMEGLGLKTKTIGSGQTDTVEFTAPASGTYAFFCSVSGHRSSGMEGSLRIE